ncbi:hypothetical protein [Chryseobacterium scophthalmum]|uniref:Uncharacterized protein n=1 Tax=Chryseobacterium scophthalmum TaxID=59733 RepID=A0A1N6EGI9_9FLAO|nr:hypothetical protein [Chryseobacterium scophthalmum]SIN82154.1 hypothetical protein SAMN05421769_0333 [Chryseobacterium scophthalmum]
MRLNKIHQDLKELYKGKERLNTILGVEFSHQEEAKLYTRILQVGQWYVAPFSFETYDSYAVKLTPNKRLLDSPVYSRSRWDHSIFSNNLANFLPMRQLRMLDTSDFVQYILDDWQLLEELSLPFREYTDSLDSLEFLKEYLHNEDKLKYLENPSEFYTKVYIDFWNHYYNTPQQKEYVELMNSMVKDKSYLPGFEIKDYGVWNARVYNAIGQKAYSYDLIDLSEQNKIQFYWQSFIQSHGFDASGYSFEILPNTNARTNLEFDLMLSHSDNIYLLPEKIQSHPLFLPLERIIKSSKSYNGDAHIEAAKTIDEELNDPLMAWDALVSAGYWSGVNFGIPNMDAWKAAIDLSEKHDWKEIHEVLTDQLEFYNHYKDKV